MVSGAAVHEYWLRSMHLPLGMPVPDWGVLQIGLSCVTSIDKPTCTLSSVTSIDKPTGTLIY